MNLYNILEVNHTATIKEIKKSYRRLAKRYHPDKNKGKYNDVEIKNINLAYEILSNENLRTDYDKTLFKNNNWYELIQNIINNNKLHIINYLFDFVYEDKSKLEMDINNMNFGNILNNVKNKVNLDIKSNIEVNLEDIYKSKKINLLIKRSINKVIINYSLDLDFDIYDEELTYENLGDSVLFINGDLIIFIKIIYDSNIFCILDNYNLMIKVKSLDCSIFDKIHLKDLNKTIYFKDDIFTIFLVKEYGFLNKETNFKGDLFIKINNIYI
jgi:curved DNA-binding protein